MKIDSVVDICWDVFNEYYPSEEQEIRNKLSAKLNELITKEIVCAWCGKLGPLDEVNKHIYEECEKRPEAKLLKIIEQFLLLRSDVIKALEQFEINPEVSSFLEALASHGKDTTVSAQNS
jgi:hypothetical protein